MRVQASASLAIPPATPASTALLPAGGGSLPAPMSTSPPCGEAVPAPSSMPALPVPPLGACWPAPVTPVVTVPGPTPVPALVPLTGAGPGAAAPAEAACWATDSAWAACGAVGARRQGAQEGNVARCGEKQLSSCGQGIKAGPPRFADAGSLAGAELAVGGLQRGCQAGCTTAARGTTTGSN